MIAVACLSFKEIVPIDTPTSRNWHPGRPCVVNERKLKGEKAGGEKKGERRGAGERGGRKVERRSWGREKERKMKFQTPVNFC